MNRRGIHLAVSAVLVTVASLQLAAVFVDVREDKQGIDKVMRKEPDKTKACPSVLLDPVPVAKPG